MTAARALRNLLAHMEPQTAAAALVEEFPWADVLPQPDRAQFVTDFVRAFQASAEMGQWTALAQTVRDSMSLRRCMPILSWSGNSPVR